MTWFHIEKLSKCVNRKLRAIENWAVCILYLQYYFLLTAELIGSWLDPFHKAKIKTISSKNQGKKVPQEKLLELFVPDTLKTIFWMAYLTSRWTKSGHFFIFEKGNGAEGGLDIPSFIFKIAKIYQNNSNPFQVWI